MSAQDIFLEITDNNLPGQNTLDLRINSAAVQRTGISPNTIGRTLRLLVDGEIVASFRYSGEKIDIRLKASNQLSQIDQLLEYRLPDQDGNLIPLSQLVSPTYSTSPSTIRHYNYRRSITVEADIDKSVTDEVKANELIKNHWQSIRHEHPNIDIDFSGLLDDIQESLNAIGLLSY